MRMLPLAGLALLLVVGAGCSGVGARADTVVAAYERRTTLPRFADLDAARAQAIGDAVVVRLAARQQPAVGWKVGFTNPALQKLFQVDAPAYGVLFPAQLMANGSTVPVAAGTRLLAEADLLVRVRDEGVNTATTPLEVLVHLSEVIPFIELPDPLYAAEPPITGVDLIAVNLGARGGVLGTPIPVRPTAEFAAALAAMTVVTTDATGAEVGRARGDALLGHPCHVVSWLARALAARGERLRAGQLISLGSYAKPQPARAGGGLRVRYEGLTPAPAEVAVSFR